MMTTRGITLLAGTFVLLLLIVACTGNQGPAGPAGLPGPLPKLETIEVDLQPDPATLVHQDLNGNKEFDPGEPFSIRAALYTPGTNTKVGDFVCDGVFVANVKIAALDKAPAVSNATGGQFSNVKQTFTLANRGSLFVVGGEPGTGPNSNERAIVGGTGEFAGATGVLKATTVLGASLTPGFSAPPVAGVPVTFLSARMKLEYRRITQ